MLGSMKKRIIVTGATSGIGLEIVNALAEQQHEIILISRNPQKLSDTVSGLSRNYWSASFTPIQADLSSMQDIIRAVQQIKERYTTIDVLINNAGGVIHDYKKTADGLEYSFAFNHLSYFLLTGQLLPLLANSADPRIVVVSSEAHRGRKFHFDAVYERQPYIPMQAYGESKLGNLYFTYQLAEKLAGTAITVNALHPGIVRLPDTGTVPWYRKLLRLLLRRNRVTPAEAAQTPVFLATSDEVQGVNGAYFIKKIPVMSSRESLKEEPAKRLWELSEQITGFQYDAIINQLPKLHFPEEDEI